MKSKFLMYTEAKIGTPEWKTTQAFVNNKRIDKELKEESETKVSQDKEYFYRQTVAASMAKLGDMEKCMIKHEINNILFKYQMRTLQDSKYR